MRNRRWTAEELELCRKVYESEGLKAAAAAVGRTYAAMKVIGTERGWRSPARQRPWTTKEQALIQDGADIATLLAATGRTAKAIESKARELGVKLHKPRGPEKHWTAAELAMVRNGACPMRVAEAVGRTPRAVKEKAKQLGVKLGRMPSHKDWPEQTIARATRLRESGASISQIAKSTGAPFGTVRHWVYGY